MSENANPLNDFLEMEENNSGMFADIPFANPAAQTVVQNTSPQAQTPVKQPVVNIAQIQNPTPNAQGSLFDNAVTQTPIAKEPTAQNHPTNAAQTIANATDPFSAALANAKAQSDSRLVDNCANRDAVFCYGKAKEPITDHDCTFEELREKYEIDFPELEESKKVEWTVTYGKEIKAITNPDSDKVYEIKAEIEKSKKFLDGIKKAKSEADKNPECIVKPRIKAQSKGEIIPLSSYKEFCSTKTEAQKSDKAIVLLPSSDGRIYQMRKTPVGEFIAETDYLSEFQNITPGFKMTIPKIPMHLLLFIWDFFAGLSKRYELEALVHILYDTKRGKYTVRVPRQKLTHVSVESVMDEEYPEHMIHVMDIHSHNTMSAHFSPIDDEDEKPTRLYAVMGRLDKVLPEITVRASCGGKFIPIEPTDVFDIKSTSFPHPKVWDEKIQLPKSHEKFALPAPKPHRFWRLGEKV